MSEHRAMTDVATPDAAEEAKALRKKGNELLQLGRPQAALECFEQALSCNPSDTSTLNDRGNALQDLQRYAEAIESYDEALRIKRELPATLTNRGGALRKLRRFDAALRDLDAALAIRPAFAEALNSRGNVLRDLGRLEEALASFDAALALKPEFVMAHCNRGNTLLDLRQPRAAFACFDGILQHLPDDVEALFGRASALLQLQESLEVAIADFARAADGGIDRAETLVGRAAALAALQRHGEAAECLADLLVIAPEREYAQGSLAYSWLQTCNWSGLQVLAAKIVHDLSEGKKTAYPSALLPLTDLPDLQLMCASALVKDTYRQDSILGPCAGRSAAGGRRRLRVAYVSADFREHPVSHLLVGVLEHHDRSDFEVIGVSLRTGGGGEFEGRVRGAFDRFIEVAERGDREVAQSLRELEVDIAVDLMGLTQGFRLGIFAYRCAPVQVSYLGYAGTTGASYIDYLLADAVVIPPGEETGYRERIVRLPHCYLPNDDRREIASAPTRSQAGLPEQGLVFCAFTNAYKINPPVFGVWMRLLREIPGSVLWLRAMGAESKGNLQREAGNRGVDPQRLIFAPHVSSMAEHLGRQTLADLYLDTLPYNAHSTTCDALWAGVPVLTCTGRSFASRVAASALTAVGLPELITHNLQDYEHKALELAHNPEQLRKLRAKLAQQRAGAPLFDTAGYCRSLEDAYRSMCSRTVTFDSNSPEAYYKQGNAYMEQNDPGRALECYERQLALDPAHAPGWSNRGTALQALNRFVQALESYDRALALRADIPQIHNSRGLTLRALQRDVEAMAAFEHAIALRPAFVDALINRGNALRDAGRPEAALEGYQRVLQIDPDCSEALCNRGNVLLDLRRPAEALESYDQALQHKPQSAVILASRTTALEALSLHEEAARGLERLLQISPGYEYALGRLLQARLHECSWDLYSQHVAQAAAELAAGRRAVHPFSALAATDSAELQLRAAELHSPAVRPEGNWPASRAGRPHRKLRLAYVSADFREHAASYLLAGVFEQHDRNSFETTAVSLVPPDDSAIGRRVRRAFDRFVDVTQRTDAELVALLRALEIDVAIDLMGHTHMARPQVFAHRVAPVQVNYLGYPGTFGGRCMDYIIADDFLIPPESARHYSEQVVYLPECFQANDDRAIVGPQPTRSQAGLPQEGLVFCTFNSSFKLNPPVFEVWMRLLREVPDSTLWLLADKSATRANLLREAAARGVDGRRLVFAEKLPYAQHLGRLGLADLFLDTLPYNAGATASDALRMGVPVLTCAGEALAARMAGSLLRAVGLPELITRSLEEYERKALELASTPGLLDALRTRLAGNLQWTPLFETARICRHLEAAYREMHERALRGAAPASFSVARLQ
jgi:predicted O-linked N-acetylglucosamine transferase (SPINDLY family)